ncbi:MAG: pyridoxal phosphate-dependent aminotransferase [Muribaculaceae bacterium]|nr:pyridoxal phosphate-dependent aminotransferase [Muribaculaceae bacterium]
MIEWFDNLPDRRGSGSYKWDSTELSDVIPLWVADMDFRTAPAIIEALRRRVDHGVFGYVRVPDRYYAVLTEWMHRRHGFDFSRDDVIYTSGVVPAISATIKALSDSRHDGVVVQTPVYNCFFSSIRNNKCRIVESPLKRVDIDGSKFTYSIDFDDLEQKLSDPRNALLLLCNPHNPAGRCWSADELGRIGELCKRHGVTVISDEIHCELVMPGHRFTPFAVASDAPCVTLSSPSKAFNTAGLQIANIICHDAEKRRLIDRAINDNEVCDVNPFGVAGLIAAYTEGEQWLAELIEYLWNNYNYLCKRLHGELPDMPVTKLEATYLPWVDVSSLGIASDEIEHFLLENHKVWINAGEMYGKDGFIRINIATSRAMLEEGLNRMIEGLKELQKKANG